MGPCDHRNAYPCSVSNPLKFFFFFGIISDISTSRNWGAGQIRMFSEYLSVSRSMAFGFKCSLDFDLELLGLGLSLGPLLCDVNMPITMRMVCVYI